VVLAGGGLPCSFLSPQGGLVVLLLVQLVWRRSKRTFEEKLALKLWPLQPQVGHVQVDVAIRVELRILIDGRFLRCA